MILWRSEMDFRFSRREMMYGAGGAALARSFEMAADAAPARQWPILEGPDTPKLALSLGDGGGPLPANLPPTPPAAGGRGGGGYGGYLQAKPDVASAPPAEATAGRGSGA